MTCFSWLHVASDPAASAYFTIVAIVLVLGWSSSIAMVSSLTMGAHAQRAPRRRGGPTAAGKTMNAAA